MKHHMVYSLPLLMNWWYSPRRRLWAHIHIKQKLPIKIYIWICCSDTPTISIWNIITYNIERKRFEESSLDFLYNKKIEKEIWEYMQNESILSETKNGYKISFLIESSRWYWFDITRWICFGCSLAQHVHRWEQLFDTQWTLFHWSLGGIEKWALAYDVNFFRSDKTSHSKDLSMSWFTNYVMTCEDPFPVIQIWSRCYVEGDENNKYDISYNETSHKIIHVKDVWGRTNDMEWIWFECLLFTLWTPFFSRYIKSIYVNQDFESSQEEKSLQELCKERDISFVEYNRLSDQSEHIYQNIANTLLAYMKRPHQSTFKKLMTSLVKCWFFHAIAEKEEECLMDLYSRFCLCKKTLNEMIAFVPVSWSASWWTFLAVVKKWASRQTLLSFLSNLKKEKAKNVDILYRSWTDWICSDWVLLHQHIPKKILSSYISLWTVECVAPDGQRRFWDYFDLLQENHKWILLDTIWKKLYVWGKKLTSKEVSSQSMTVELLMHLIKTNWYIHNSELPLSSYSSNKNDMVGKILIPLRKLVKKHFNQSLNILCTWSLFDFYVKMPNSPHVFHILNKIPAMM